MFMKIQIVFFYIHQFHGFSFYITVYTMYSTGFKNTTPKNVFKILPALQEVQL